MARLLSKGALPTTVAVAAIGGWYVAVTPVDCRLSTPPGVVALLAIAVLGVVAEGNAARLRHYGRRHVVLSVIAATLVLAVAAYGAAFLAALACLE